MRFHQGRSGLGTILHRRVSETKDARVLLSMLDMLGDEIRVCKPIFNSIKYEYAKWLRFKPDLQAVASLHRNEKAQPKRKVNRLSKKRNKARVVEATLEEKKAESPSWKPRCGRKLGRRKDVHLLANLLEEGLAKVLHTSTTDRSSSKGVAANGKGVSPSGERDPQNGKGVPPNGKTDSQNEKGVPFHENGMIASKEAPSMKGTFPPVVPHGAPISSVSPGIFRSTKVLPEILCLPVYTKCVYEICREVAQLSSTRADLLMLVWQGYLKIVRSLLECTHHEKEANTAYRRGEKLKTEKFLAHFERTKEERQRLREAHDKLELQTKSYVASKAFIMSEIEELRAHNTALEGKMQRLVREMEQYRLSTRTNFDFSHFGLSDELAKKLSGMVNDPTMIQGTTLGQIAEEEGNGVTTNEDGKGGLEEESSSESSSDDDEETPTAEVFAGTKRGGGVEERLLRDDVRVLLDVERSIIALKRKVERLKGQRIDVDKKDVSVQHDDTVFLIDTQSSTEGKRSRAMTQVRKKIGRRSRRSQRYTSFRKAVTVTVKDIIPPGFTSLLANVPVSYKYQHMQVSAVHMVISRIYADLINARQSRDSEENHRHRQQSFSSFIFDFFLLRYEIPQIAEHRVVDLLGTVRKEVGSSVRIHMFARLIGVIGEPSEEAVRFFIRGLDCLLQGTAGGGFVETPDALQWINIDIAIQTVSRIFDGIYEDGDPPLKKIVQDTQKMRRSENSRYLVCAKRRRCICATSLQEHQMMTPKINICLTELFTV